MEEWRGVKTWKRLYEVSDQGRVRSLDRVVLGGLWGHMRYKGRVLKAPVSSSGYRVVCFTTPGRREYHNVHVLVARTFIGPCPPTLEVCHNNGFRPDCSLTNLRYDTRRNNALDRNTHGTMNNDGCPGEANGLAKLTDAAVRAIRADQTSLLRELADRYGVSLSAIHLVRRGKTWTHVV